MFYQNPPSEASLYTLLSQLEKLDQELAEETQEKGCRFCGGRLDSACYPRKARGVPAELEEGFSTRHSFCCAREGCRKRITPPSFRFLGRRVYAAAWVVLLTALAQGVTPGRARRLRELVGVSRRTLQRWRQWWRQEFVGTAFWKCARGRVGSAVSESTLPLSLLEAFSGNSGAEATMALLRFLLPLTTCSGRGAK